MNSVDQRNWLERNWKWLLPGGCLVVVLLVAGFVAAVFFSVAALMKHSDAYVLAFDAARASPAVTAAVGTPVSDGLLASGNIHESGPSGEAELSIPVSGPRGSGTVFVEARKATGAWTVTTLVFENDADHQRTDLRAEAAHAAAAR
jgi:hypothetical protein